MMGTTFSHMLGTRSVAHDQRKHTARAVLLRCPKLLPFANVCGTSWWRHAGSNIYRSHAKLSNGGAWMMQLFFLTTLVCTVLQNELIHSARILQAGLIHIVNYEMLIFPLTAALNICLVCPRKRYYSHYLVFEHLWLKVLWPPFGMSQRCTMARSCMALVFPIRVWPLTLFYFLFWKVVTPQQ